MDSSMNFLFFVSFFNFLTSAIDNVNSTSSKESNYLASEFHRLYFFGVKTVESFIASKIKFPSSPKTSKNWLY